MSQAPPALPTHTHPHIMVGGGCQRHEASDAKYRPTRERSASATSGARSTASNDIPATPNSPSLEPRANQPAPASTSSSPTTPHESATSRSESHASTAVTSHSSHNLNQHSRGYDQSGFPLSEPRGLATSSPSSPRLQPTYRSTRSLGGSEATSPSRIKVKNLSHIQSFAGEEFSARQTLQRRSGGTGDPQRQYEISAMPVTDIIEMVAGLLTKITTTNDQQHEHIHRPTHPLDDQSHLNAQASCVLAFHGKNVPSISILSYLSRIHKYCPTTYEVFLSLLVYFDRMTESVNKGLLENLSKDEQQQPQHIAADLARSPMPMDTDAPVQSIEGPSHDYAERPNHSQVFVVDSFNIHRLVIAGVTCASKFFSDVFYTNSRYAKVCLQ